MPETRNAQDGQTHEATIAADALSAHAQYLRDLAGVEENPYTLLGLQNAARHADEAASGYLKAVPPPLPDEPSDGTVLAGSMNNAWVRDDASGADGEPISRWWMTGKRKAHTWEEALQHGADFRRRLVELPDPRDRDAMAALETRSYQIAQTPGLHLDDAAYVVMALAERGNQP
jgi:hypothetical protein